MILFASVYEKAPGGRYRTPVGSVPALVEELVGLPQAEELETRDGEYLIEIPDDLAIANANEYGFMVIEGDEGQIVATLPE